MSRFKFDDISVSPRKVSSVSHDGITEKAFLSAALTFPMFRDQNRIPGVVCVTALFQKDLSLYILDLFHYDEYAFPLAQFFQSVYDRFKFNVYAAPAKQTEMTRFFSEMEKRRYFKEDSIYPQVLPMDESKFLNFEPVFYLLPDRLHYRRKINLNVGALVDSIDFRSAAEMPELCALTVAAAFALDRGWQAFELDQIDNSQPKEDPF